MSAPQTPDTPDDSGSGRVDEPAETNFIQRFMQQAWMAENAGHILQVDPDAALEDGDASYYDDDEETEEDGVDEEEDSDEYPHDEDDEDDEDEEDTIVDEGRPLPYLTRRQLFMLLQGQTFHHVILGDTEADGDDDAPPRTIRRRGLSGASAFPKVPSEEGKKLMTSGLFGCRERPRTTATSTSTRSRLPGARPVPLRLLERELGLANTPAGRHLNERLMAQNMVPATRADLAIRYRAPVYLGQFSDDGNFFYSATKDFRVRMYDTANVNEWQHYKTVVHPAGRWTLTDASFSPDNRWLAFTSMMPQVCLAPTDPHDEGEPYLLDLSTSAADGSRTDAELFHASYYADSFAIFSVRFSGDGRELVAGTNAHSLIVYDIESRTVLHKIRGHEDDVNAVCFGDKTSPHLLYSGSDDATIKVWDRRSLANGQPAGAFVGHCEGITYVDSKGDGRYILSNGKDQTMRLWDLRMAMSNESFERNKPLRFTRHSIYDYRFQPYDDDMYFKHPHDNSVVTFRGHTVERTLLRCHFSPPGSSDGSYVYSASHSGDVYIWNLDATVAGVIHVQSAIQNTMNGLAAQEAADSGRGNSNDDGNNDGNNAGSARIRSRYRRSVRRFEDESFCVRDASWHPTAPVLVASSFDSENMEVGMCTMHSSALSHDGNTDGREFRLYDEKMRPLNSQQAMMNAPVFW